MKAKKRTTIVMELWMDMEICEGLGDFSEVSMLGISEIFFLSSSVEDLVGDIAEAPISEMISRSG